MTEISENAELREERRAALNVMEDAILARKKADALNEQLRNEIAERMRVEAALRVIEERQTFLLKVSDTLRMLTGSAAIEAEVSRILGEHLKADRAYYADIEPDGGHAVVRSDYIDGVQSIVGRHRVEDFGPTLMAAFRTGKTLVIEDVARHPELTPTERASYAALSMSALVVVPQAKDGRWIGVLAVNTAGPRAWTPSEISLIEEVAERSWPALERAQAEDALERQRLLYEGVLTTTPDLAYIFDLDHRFIYANEGLLTMWGKTWDEAIGRNCLELGYEPWHAEMHDREIEQVVATKQPIRGEVPFTGTFGRRIYDYILTPVLDARGEVIAIAGTTRDVTDINQAKEDLRESEARFRSLADSSPVLMWRTDHTGAVFVNRHYLEYFGQPFEAIAGMGWAKFLHPDDADAYIATYRDAWERQESFESQCRFRRHDGEYRWLHNVGSPHRAPDGSFLGLVGGSTDVTERRLAEEDARRAREYAEATLRSSSVPLLVLESDLRVVTGNEAFYRRFAVTHEETEGRLVYDLGNGQWNIPKLRELLEDILPHESWFEHFEVEHEFESIGRKVMLLNARRMEVVKGGPERIILVIEDITTRKRAEEGMARLAAIVEASDDAIISKDLDGIIRTWNTGAEKIFGYTAAEAVGRPVTLLMPPDRLDEEPYILERIRHGETVVHYETVRRRKDGSQLHVSLTVSPIRDETGKVIGASKVARDVSERVLYEEELQRAHDELEGRVEQRTSELSMANMALTAEIEERRELEKIRADLVHRIVGAQEDERKRIARDLHDQLGQRLTALRLKLASLRDNVSDSPQVESVDQLVEIAARLDSDVSFLAAELRPASLDDFGLQEALRMYASEWSILFGIRAEFHSNVGPNARLSEDAEIHLYRIAQEALNNISKHANASEATVTLERFKKGVALVIEDNGVGFDTSAEPEAVDGHGYGLAGIAERAKLIRAEFEVESTPGSGTAIYVRIPR
ncbi:MAG: PAS domain S-box protein [Acidobacteria bacterium]|nr:PAS domain S-box protein [Acidobacteriota bacterium]